MNIIGVLGFAGSGKDTVGTMFREAGYEKASFAATLKDATAAIFGWKRSLLEGDTLESRTWRDQVDPFWTKHLGYEVTPRKMLQRLGTDACRNVIGDNIWVYSMLSNMDPNKKYVITDVRFPNEIRMIQEAGGILIRVRRGPEPEWYDLALQHNTNKIINIWGEEDFGYDSNNKRWINSMSSKYPNIHYSEWAWVGSKVASTFDNDSSLEDLCGKVQSFIKTL